MSQRPIHVFISASNYLTSEGIVAMVDSLPNYKPSIAAVGQINEQLTSSSDAIAVLEIPAMDEWFVTQLKRDLSEISHRVLVVIEDVSKSGVSQLLKSGFKNIITKCCNREEIIAAIYATTRTEQYLCNCVIEVLTNPDKQQTTALGQLSPREREVLALIADGLKTNEIAEKLFLSVHTVNSHRKNMLKKLNLKSPIELIVYAVENNIQSK
ncbi:MAG: response regulator transcription factor [Fulvivirga sp.]